MPTSSNPNVTENIPQVTFSSVEEDFSIISPASPIESEKLDTNEKETFSDNLLPTTGYLIMKCEKLSLMNRKLDSRTWLRCQKFPYLRILEVSKSRKQISKFSFEQKKRTNMFLYICPSFEKPMPFIMIK